jgi:hypothetical protein
MVAAVVWIAPDTMPSASPVATIITPKVLQSPRTFGGLRRYRMRVGAGREGVVGGEGTSAPIRDTRRTLMQRSITQRHHKAHAHVRPRFRADPQQQHVVHGRGRRHVTQTDIPPPANQGPTKGPTWSAATSRAMPFFLRASTSASMYLSTRDVVWGGAVGCRFRWFGWCGGGCSVLPRFAWSVGFRRRGTAGLVDVFPALRGLAHLSGA